MVFVHGYTNSTDGFAHVVEPLTDLRRIVLIDLLGHGKSPRAVTYSYDALTRAIVEFLLLEIGRPVDMLGHSLGGRVILPIAARHGDLVRSLILEDTWADQPDIPADDRAQAVEVMSEPDDLALAAVLEAARGELSVEDELIRSVRGEEWFDAHHAHNLAHRDPVGVAQLARQIFVDGVPFTDLGSISCPTTVVVGERDEPFVAASQRMADGIDGSHLVTITGAYHSPHLTHTSDWVDVVRDHLARVDARS